ncbi:MAG: efflux RND transporter periplasmic adaptor subunit [Candidatus Sericytochromatia bacterium]
MRPLHLLLLSFIVVSTACQKGAETEAAASPSPSALQAKAPANVRVLSLSPSAFVNRLALTGSAEPWKAVTLSSEMAGKLNTLAIQEGGFVKQGQIVARLDAQILTAQRQQAEANYQLSLLQEKWQQRTLSKQVDVAESGYSNNATTYARQKNLYDQQVISAQTYDNAESSLTNSRQQLDLQRLSQSSGNALNRQQVQVASSNLALARVNLNKTAIGSPLNGFVNKVYVEAGEVINPGAPIADVLQMNPVKLSVGIPEREIDAMRVGTAVSVRFDALPGVVFPGRVVFVALASEGPSRTFPLRIRIDNPQLRIRAGMVGRVELAKGTEGNALVIPQDAVIDRRDGRFVFVERNGVAQEVAVELGSRNGLQVSVTKGLKSGDRLIIFGHRSLLSGDPVKVQEVRAQGAPTPESAPVSRSTAIEG